MLEIFVELRSEGPKLQATDVNIELRLNLLVGVHNHITWFQQNIYACLAWLFRSSRLMFPNKLPLPSPMDAKATFNHTKSAHL